MITKEKGLRCNPVSKVIAGISPPENDSSFAGFEIKRYQLCGDPKLGSLSAFFP